MAARCRETSAPTVLRTTLSASMKKLPRSVLLVIISVSWTPNPPPQKRGPPKGCVHSWGLGLSTCSNFCIKVCRKSRVKTGKNGGPPAAGASSNRTRLCVMFLIVSSYVPTPTSHQNWGRRLIGKALFETPCHAPFRINLVRPLTDHPHKPRVASSLSLFL